MPVVPYIKHVQATRIKKSLTKDRPAIRAIGLGMVPTETVPWRYPTMEIAELTEKKANVVSITKVGTKENYNVKFKTNQPPFVNGVMTLNVDLTGDYPFKPPSVRFAHNLHHPNVDRGGDLCIPILSYDNWKPATSLNDILNSILELLVEPDLSRPIRFDIVDEYVKDPALYKKNVAECMTRLPP